MKTIHTYRIDSTIKGEIPYDASKPETYVEALEAVNLKRKAPDEIWGAIKPNQYLSEETGQAIAEWINGGATFDQDAEQLKRDARDISTLGTGALKQHWDNLNKAQKKILQPHLDELKTLAAKADEERTPDADEACSENPFDDKFTGKEQAA